MTHLKEHPRFRDLYSLLKPMTARLSRTWSKTVYRCVDLKWARPEFLISGHGTMKHGGRWMRPNVTPVVHAASSDSIALKESRKAFSRYHIRRPRNAPRVIVEIDATLEFVADLTAMDQLFEWPTLNELLDEDWEKINSRGAETLPQAVGKALWELEFEGIVVPSARDRRGRNLVWFPGNLTKRSRLRISGEETLDKWIES